MRSRRAKRGAARGAPFALELTIARWFDATSGPTIPA